MTQPTLILGTAGHIDHGKTALVRALTGTDTDRLPQEQARGMTIDIGFAELRWGDRQIGIIDVPGHERFIKNMLAGAATIDLALLVVAADDSVMPQTREHLAILELLGVTSGVIAITKCDLRDDDWLELVAEEIDELVTGSGLANAEVIRTAVPVGGQPQGLDELRRAIGRAADSIAARDAGDQFRLCVDRSFTVAGRGTVVTGTVCSGQAKVGDDLEWLPAGKIVHLRGLHNHGESVNLVERGQRAAVNLAGVHHDEIGRGDVLASPGFLQATTCLTVRVVPLPESRWPLKHRGRYTLHLGTQAVPAELYLFESNALTAGGHEHGKPEPAWGQLHCQTPVVAVWGQPFVLRLESPVATLGGGHVVQPATRPVRRRHVDLARLAELDSADPVARAAAGIYFLNDALWSEDDLRASCGLSSLQLADVLEQLQSQAVCVVATLGQGRTQLLHADRLAQWEASVLRVVDQFHKSHPLSVGMPRPRLVGQLEKRLDRSLAEAVIERLLGCQQLTQGSAGVARADFTPRLDAGSQRLLTKLRACFADSAFQPPTLKELVAALDVPEKSLRPVLQLAVDTGELVHLDGELYLTADAERTLRERLRKELSTVDGLTVSQIRDILDTSRKFAVPICQYLDRIGLTRRRGDLRILAPPSP